MGKLACPDPTVVVRCSRRNVLVRLTEAMLVRATVLCLYLRKSEFQNGLREGADHVDTRIDIAFLSALAKINLEVHACNEIPNAA